MQTKNPALAALRQACSKGEPIAEIPQRYCTVHFSNGVENTARLVITEQKARSATIAELSRLFPFSEASKMKRCIVSQPFNSWDEAFYHK